MMGLKKGTIGLRAPEPEDVDFLFQLENNRQLWPVSNTLLPYSRFDLEQYLFSSDKADPFAVRQVRLMIELNQNEVKTTIGTIDLFDIDAVHRRAGVGIVVVSDFRNHNYATTALSICMEYASNELNLHQLYCNIDENNIASLKLFKKSGFEEVGLKKEWNIRNGRWVNEFLLQKIIE